MLEGRGLRVNAVEARLHVWKREATVGVRLQGATKARLHVDDRDRGATDRAATGIDDLAAETARGVALRGRGDRGLRADRCDQRQAND